MPVIINSADMCDDQFPLISSIGRGPRGEKGDDGSQGFSPIVSITDIVHDGVVTGHDIVMTDTYGDHEYEVPTYAGEEATREANENARIAAELQRQQDTSSAIASANAATAATQAAIANAEAATEATHVAIADAEAAAGDTRAAIADAKTATASAQSATLAATAATEAAQTAITAAQAATAAAVTATGDAEDATDAANAAAAMATDAAEHITDGYFPDLISGAALSLTSPTSAESTWAQRVTDAVDGTATVKSIHGRTVVWNQILNPSVRSVTGGGVTLTMTDGGFVTISGTATGNNELQANENKFNVVSGHKYLAHMNSNAHMRFKFYIGSASIGMYPCGSTIVAATAGDEGVIRYRLNSSDSSTDFDETYTTYLMVFDLTAMFGAGNEPSTVAEFEALYPEPYYPYDAGSLLSVQMEGIETVGFNQIPSWELGGISSSNGEETTSTTTCRTGFIPVDPNTAYCLSSQGAHLIGLRFYDSNKVYIGASNNSNYRTAFVFTPATTPISGGVDTSNTRYMRFVDTNATTGEGNCLNISWSGYRNGEYEPYWKSERVIPAATYFPSGMRSAGTVHDELTSDAAIVRVGAVDLGTLTWTKYEGGTEPIFTTTPPDFFVSARDVTTIQCGKYDVLSAMTYQTFSAAGVDKAIATVTNIGAANRLGVHDTAYTDAAAFKVAMQGVMLHYALATPTTTPIDPPLNLTYRVEQGGTESVMHTDPTAAPTWRTRYPFDLAATVMANIAPMEQPVATAPHAIGDLLCVGWHLYRVIDSIASGEQILVGVNVMETTMAAELAALQ